MGVDDPYASTPPTRVLLDPAIGHAGRLQALVLSQYPDEHRPERPVLHRLRPTSHDYSPPPSMAASASSAASVSFTYSMVARSLKFTSGAALRWLREPVLPFRDAEPEVRLLPRQPEPLLQGLPDGVAMAELHATQAAGPRASKLPT